MNKVLKKILIPSLFTLSLAGCDLVSKEEVPQDTKKSSISTFTQIDNTIMHKMDIKTDLQFDEYLTKGGINSPKFQEMLSKIAQLDPDNQRKDFYGCSVFSAQDNKGEKIFGRNLDWSNGSYLLSHHKPEDGYKFLSFASIPFISPGKTSLTALEEDLLLDAPYWALDGINEKGLSVALMALYNTEPVLPEEGKTTIHYNSVIPLLLQKAKSVDEAIGILKNYSIYFGQQELFGYYLSCHYLIADKNGNSAMVEYLPDTVAIIKKSKDEFMLGTNFPLATWDGDLSTLDPVYNWRYPIAFNELENNNGILNSEKAMKILKSVKMETSLTTVYSAVYNGDNSIDIAISQNYHDIKNIAFDDFE